MMDPQLDVPIQQSPQEIRALLDAARPIPVDVWFQPYRTTGLTFLKHLLLMGCLVGGPVSLSIACLIIGLTGSLLDGTQKIRDVGDVLVVSALYVVLAGLLIIVVRVLGLSLWYEWLAVRDQRAGALRRGIFLTSDAMIIRLKTRRCDIIPRNAILGVRRWGTRSKTWCVVFRAPDGKESRCDIDFPPFDGLTRELPEVDYMRKWAGVREDVE